MGVRIVYHNFVIVVHLVSCLLPLTSNALRHKMHRHMSRDELVDIFGVKSYNEVPEYEIIQPIRLQDDSTTMSRDQSFSQSRDSIGEHSYFIYAFGEEYTLDLEPDNNDAFPEHLVLHHWHSTNHTSLRAQRLHRNHGYYVGHVRGRKLDSMVSLSERDGKLLNGFVASNEMAFFIKPLPVKFHHFLKEFRYDKQGQQRALVPPHLVFKHKEMKTCGTEIHTEEKRKSHKRHKRFLPVTGRKYIELMIVSDSTMYDYHGNEMENYLKTVMSIAATAFRSPSISVNISLHVVRCLVLEAKEVDPLIVPDAQSSLRNFCEWQKRVYPEDIHDPQHFDIATLITRHDLSRKDLITGSTIRGVLGLANMASACVKSRRCSIVEDNGLATGLTVAHEIGHALGMEHDGAGNSCLTSGHIMASVTSSGPGAYTWSRCSVGYLNSFLRSPISHCLNDEPDMNKNLSLYRGWRPGQLFHRNEQCRFLYADSSGSCSHRQNDCEKLWCLRLRDEKEICSTNRSPPADGTECDEGKWCIGGKCVSYGAEGPEPIHGQWSEWEPMFSDCSRTCGGGIRRKRRHCNSPTPSFGGSHCQGEDMEIETCNVFDCPESSQYRFSEEQCKSRDRIPYKDELTSWLPYTDRSRRSGDDFCKYSCVSYDLKKVVKFGHFIDGTRCDVINPLQEYTSMCVDGKCQYFGCDLVADSNRRFDSCGVCDGDNSTSDVQTGTKHILLSNDYTTVLEIPIGSTFINITLLCGGCHFALREHDQYMFGGEGERGKSRSYSTGDDVISYVGRDEEIIQIRGPTHSKMTIQVSPLTGDVLEDDDKGSEVRWVFFKPIKDRPVYRWSVVNTPCSKTCGFGIHTPDVICIQLESNEITDGKPVEHFHCLHLKSPDLVPEPCNEFDCPYRLEVGEWGDCSVSCGVTGVRVRQAYCVRENTPGLTEVLPYETCESKGKPVLVEPCSGPVCNDDEKASCNETIMASEGSFTSPNHPGYYPTSVDCMTGIQVNPGYWIDLTFQSFELEPSTECIFDYVEVFQDQADGSSISITKLCGTRKSSFSIVVKYSSAIVLFHSDSVVTRRGFVANFSELDP